MLHLLVTITGPGRERERQQFDQIRRERGFQDLCKAIEMVERIGLARADLEELAEIAKAFELRPQIVLQQRRKVLERGAGKGYRCILCHGVE